MTDPERAIRTLFEHSYPEAIAARDPEAYLALYTPDALWIRPGGQPRSGHDAIAAGFREMLSGQRIASTFQAIEIECHGATATVLGTADATVTAIATNELQRQAFSALWIVRQIQGTWLIHRQIWTPTL
jgi:uncharacterized protein (TIGR02246 family)